MNKISRGPLSGNSISVHNLFLIQFGYKYAMTNTPPCPPCLFRIHFGGKHFIGHIPNGTNAWASLATLSWRHLYMWVLLEVIVGSCCPCRVDVFKHNYDSELALRVGKVGSLPRTPGLAEGGGSELQNNGARLQIACTLAT